MNKVISICLNAVGLATLIHFGLEYLDTRDYKNYEEGWDDSEACQKEEKEKLEAEAKYWKERYIREMYLHIDPTPEDLEKTFQED